MLCESSHAMWCCWRVWFISSFLCISSIHGYNILQYNVLVWRPFNPRHPPYPFLVVYSENESFLYSYQSTSVHCVICRFLIRASHTYIPCTHVTSFFLRYSSLMTTNFFHSLRRLAPSYWYWQPTNAAFHSIIQVVPQKPGRAGPDFLLPLRREGITVRNASWCFMMLHP